MRSRISNPASHLFLSLQYSFDHTAMRFISVFPAVTDPDKQDLTAVTLECLRVLPVLDLLQCRFRSSAVL